MKQILKGTISRQPSEFNLKGSKGFYIDEINRVLEQNPNLRIRTNSRLYQLALLQYNRSLTKGVVNRPAVPAWFCGYIDPTTGLLRSEIEAPPAIIKPIIKYYDTPTREIPVSDISDTEYPIDKCLEYGCPGGEIWRHCQLGEEVDESNLDWSDAFYNGGTMGGTGSCEPTVPQGKKTPFSPGAKIMSAEFTSYPTIKWSVKGIDDWPTKQDGGKILKGMIYVNGKKVEWFKVGQTSQSLKNIEECGGKYCQLIKANTFANIQLVSVDGKMATDALSIIWPKDVVCNAPATGSEKPESTSTSTSTKP